MPVFLKAPHQIEQMRVAARIVAETYEILSPYVQPGVTTEELDRRAEEFIRRSGATPTYKGYSPPGHTPFPATICVAVNDQVVHGIPSPRQVLREGDIVGIDIGATYNGWVGDACRTYTVGNVDADSRRLIETTRECLRLGVARARAGSRLGDIGAAIQRRAEDAGYSVVRQLYGHGIGRSLWEEPSVRHYGVAGTGLELRVGMVFTIEPMINAGAPDIRVASDGWTISTADGSRSAQFEDTLALTERGTEILTQVTSPAA
jgi:methionyl aminopeptidase